MPTTSTSVSDALATLATWQIVALATLVVLILAGLVWLVVRWRRKRAVLAAPQPRGPSLAKRLKGVWQPFYDHIPRRARHFPTVVVVGEAGVGKSHAIDVQVDWRGQANQFVSNVTQPGLLQLYLGPDVVVHELSAPLLRDVSRGAKRALEQLWDNMGPSATVVIVLDARTLASTPQAALRELAQLVRGKIGLFPRRAQTHLEFRIFLAHLDQIDGYDEFAACLGVHHRPLDLELLGPDYTDAHRLVAAYDGHLAYALTKRDGDAFDRLVRFYGLLPDLLTPLRTLLAALEGKHEPYGARYAIGGLYLGSLVSCSQVGNPFAIEQAQIASSIDRHNRRGLRGGLLTAAAGLALAGIAFLLHATRIAGAEAAYDRLCRELVVTPAGEACQLSETDMDIVEEDMSETAEDVTRAVGRMRRSENLWLSRVFVKRKKHLEQEYERLIRTKFIYGKIPQADRVELLYLLGLLYASKDNELGTLILKEHNIQLWSKELGLSRWVIENYILTSDEDFSGIAEHLSVRPENAFCELPTQTCKNGREWSSYLRKLSAALKEPFVEADVLNDLRAHPVLRSEQEYAVLKKVHQTLSGPSIAPFLPRFYGEMEIDALDHWSRGDYVTLQRLSARLHQYIPDGIEPTTGWGLAELTAAFIPPPPTPDETLELALGDHELKISVPKIAELAHRSRAHALIENVFAELNARGASFEACSGGSDFFRADFKPASMGVIRNHAGAVRDPIEGRHTRASFERIVAPVLSFAGTQLRPQLEDVGDAQSDLDRHLARDDARALEARIACAARKYATEYSEELFAYYRSFELNPTSSMTLPFVLKTFTEPSSWFTEFLRNVADQAAPSWPEDEDPYFDPMRSALADFAPLVELLAEDSGKVPGLDPYRALVAQLQAALSGDGTRVVPDAPNLRERLTPMGALMLDVLRDKATDHDAQVRLWLLDSGLDTHWHAPFLAAIQEAQALGVQELQSKIRAAWTDEVRPLVRPLLRKYPFDPSADVDASIDELEATARRQGKEPGAFWSTFERLIGPVTVRRNGELALEPRVSAPPGMLTLTRDLERLSQTLWDHEGTRIPLKIILQPHALPKEPHDQRTPAMAYVRGGGSTLYAFNQRPEPHILALRWWNQDTSVVSLELRAAIGGDPRSYALEQDGPFSFYRLLDAAKNPKAAERRTTLSETAIRAATRCYPGEPSGTKNITIGWRIPVGTVTRTVTMMLVSDPWAPFAVRDCG